MDYVIDSAIAFIYLPIPPCGGEVFATDMRQVIGEKDWKTESKKLYDGYTVTFGAYCMVLDGTYTCPPGKNDTSIMKLPDYKNDSFLYMKN